MRIIWRYRLLQMFSRFSFVERNKIVDYGFAISLVMKRLLGKCLLDRVSLIAIVAFATAFRRILISCSKTHKM